MAQPQRKRVTRQRVVAHVLRERAQIPAVARRLGQHDTLTHDPLTLAPLHAVSVALPPEETAQKRPAWFRLCLGLRVRCLVERADVLDRSLAGLLGPLTISLKSGAHVMDLALFLHRSKVRSTFGGSSLWR